MFKIRNKISLLFFLITSCYVATPPLITSRSSENYWETTIGEVGTGAEVMIMPKGTYTRIAPQIISVQLWQYLNYTSTYLNCNEGKPRNYSFSNISISFIKLPEGLFNPNNIYIHKNDKKYKLILTDISGRNILSQPIKIRDKKTFYFKAPVFCSSLENAVFEMSGIYSDGKELPPVKFQINLLNPTEIKS